MLLGVAVDYWTFNSLKGILKLLSEEVEIVAEMRTYCYIYKTDRSRLLSNIGCY